MKARTRSAIAPIVLLVAVAAAVGYAYYGVERRGQQEKARQEAEEKLFSFDQDKVKEITVEAKGSTVRLTRSGSDGKEKDGWRVVSPLEADADRGVVVALLEKVAGLRRKQAIQASEVDLGRYGLEKPRVRVTLTVDGGPTETLALGDENRFDGSLFVRPTKGAVEVVGGEVKSVVEKDLFDLREKRLLILEDQDVQRMEVTARAFSYVVERSAEGWKLVAPLSEKADSITVDRVLRALRGLRATQFVQSPGPDKDYGLDKPRYLIRLVGPSNAERKLAIGAPPSKKGAPDPVTLYARVGAARELTGIQATPVKDLDADLWALRDKTVMAFDRNQVEAVRFETGGAAIEVQKKPASSGGPESWSLTSPRAAPARSWKMPSILQSLSSLRATRLVDETGKSLVAFGLDKPAQVVTLLGAGGAILGKLEMGKEEGDQVYVRGAGPRVYQIEKSKLVELPKAPEDLEEKPVPEEKPSGKES